MKQLDAHRLGRMLKQARERMGLSLRAVEQRTRIPFAWVARTEHGHYSRPAPERLATLAELLGIDARAMDGVTSGEMSEQLPKARTYFRAKYHLNPDEIAQLETLMDELLRERATGRTPNR